LVKPAAIRSVFGARENSTVYAGLVEYFKSEALINARTSTVWEVITDAANLTVWESGITAIDGEIRNGGSIRIETADGGQRIRRFRVQQMPGQVMTWTSALPLGLLKRIRTFTLSPQAGLTRFTVKEQISGHLAPFLGNTRPDTAKTLNDYVGAVTQRAELLERSS
jgi:hypothetical protein